MIYDSVNYIYTNQYSLILLVCVETKFSLVIFPLDIELLFNNGTSLRHFNNNVGLCKCNGLLFYYKNTPAYVSFAGSIFIIIMLVYVNVLNGVINH